MEENLNRGELSKMKKKREIKVIVKFTEGWEERVAKAAYNLYLRLEAQNVKLPEELENHNQD